MRSAVARAATHSSAAVHRNRHVFQEHLFHLGLFLLDAREHESRTRGRFEETRLDLDSRLELDELLLERARKAAAAEIPAVELLQEAARAALAELADRFAHEEHELRHDLFARRLRGVSLEDLLQCPRIALRGAS